MPDFYLDSTLAQDLAAAQVRKTAIAEQITALEAEETALDEKIAEIQSIQAYIADDYPATDQVSQVATFTATAGNTEVVLAWAAVSGATYRLERSTVLNNWTSATAIYEGALLTYTNTGLTNGTLYYFRVKVFKTGFTPSDWKYASATPTP